MSTILMVLMIAGLMSTVGVYAASISAPTIGVLGGTATTSVTAPTSGAIDLKWGLNTSGQVTSVDVKWTPLVAKVYKISVVAGGATHNFTTPTTGTIELTHTVPMSVTEASAINDAKVVIYD